LIKEGDEFEKSIGDLQLDEKPYIDLLKLQTTGIP
jgi:hypothetical protein